MSKPDLSGAYAQTRKEIIDAYTFLREKNMSIPSDTIEFMKDAAIEKLDSCIDAHKKLW